MVFGKYRLQEGGYLPRSVVGNRYLGEVQATTTSGCTLPSTYYEDPPAQPLMHRKISPMRKPNWAPHPGVKCPISSTATVR